MASVKSVSDNWNRYGLVSGQCHKDIIISFGGFDLNDGGKDDVILYNATNNSRTHISRNGINWPEARYMHAGDCLNGQLYIYGGFTRKKSSAFDDLWSYDLAKGWKKLSSHIPLAGHTLTKINDTHILILGGFTLSSSFNGETLLYDIRNLKWGKVTVSGVELPVIIGHSSVLYKNFVYTFGGLQLLLGKLESSNNLYALDIVKLHRILLPYKDGPAETFLHSSLILKDFMLVGGGRKRQQGDNLDIWIYQLECGTWIQVNSFNWRPSNLISFNFVRKGSSKFLTVGGFTDQGSMEPNLYEFHISDICSQFNEKICNSNSGCVYCNGICMEHNKAKSYSNCTITTEKCTVKVTENVCGLFKSCLSCVSASPENFPCHWCPKCQKCIRNIWGCDQVQECNIRETPLKHPKRCPKTCSASGCENCGDDCEYSNMRQRVSDTQIIKLRDSTTNWDCTTAEKRSNLKPKMKCPISCSEFHTCQSCMNSTGGGEPGSKECYWSASTNSCLSKSAILLACSAGQCSPFFHNTAKTRTCDTSGCVNELNLLQSLHCPESCPSFTRCSTCLKHPLCNWCSEDNGNGKGKCVSRKDCPSLLLKTYTWNYGECPAENECTNDHNDCSKEETCKDLLKGYSCECSEGYERSSTGICKPVCPGCVHGSCTAPNKCSCNFGFVGPNCTVECKCNGHSECESTTKPNVCLKCEHGTTGKYCEKCAALHVRDPNSKTGRCIKCFDHCHGHTNFCFSQEEAEKFYNDSRSSNITLEDWASNVTSGPDEKAVCVMCGDNTKGNECESCESNFFRISGALPSENCQPCQCRGHAEFCDQASGLHCDCKNKTKTPPCMSSKIEEKCWMKQCSSCLEDFYGDPSLEGAQCYRHIKTDQSYCLDPSLPVNCPNPPKPLAPLQFTYFGVTPQYVNVDIRIFLDIYVGKVNMFIANDSKVLLIKWNGSKHRIILNNEYEMADGCQTSAREVLIINENRGRKKRSANNSTKIKFHNYACRSPWCHVEFKTNTLLLVSNISHKAIVRIPFEPFNLKLAKFYVLIYATVDSSTGVVGHISSRQDHPHIDLFVFFSVFFSCFFLLLANCIIVWKMKSIYVARRQRQRRHMEMEQMRSRPFALITIDIDEREESEKRYQLPTPMSLEHTDDGVADIATFFVFLPDKRICLASALIQRRHAFRTRRPSSSHA